MVTPSGPFMQCYKFLDEYMQYCMLVLKYNCSMPRERIIAKGKEN